MVKLRDLGQWDAELDMIQPVYEILTEHPDVDKPKDLTETSMHPVTLHFGCCLTLQTAWRNMRARIVKFMDASRHAIRDEWQEILTERNEWFFGVYNDEWWMHQPHRATLPRAMELMRRPEVRAITEQNCAVLVNRDALAPLVAHFPAWVAEWRAEKEEVLLALVRATPQFAGVPADVDPLALACLAFDCKACHADALSTQVIPPLYPSLLDHECLYAAVSTDDANARPDPFDAALLWAMYEPSTDMCRERWSSETLRVGVWHSRAVEIIEACGQDPYTTTREEMDGLGVRLWCEGCNEVFKGARRQVMSWRDCVSNRSGCCYAVDN